MENDVTEKSFDDWYEKQPLEYVSYRDCWEAWRGALASPEVNALVEASNSAYSRMVDAGIGVTNEGIALVEALSLFTKKE